jgi:hypothetical protein
MPAMRTALALTACRLLTSTATADARATRESGTVSGGVALYDIPATGVSCKFARDLGRR